MERKVWSEFQHTKNDGTILKFRLQDCTKDHFDEVSDMYLKHFSRDESVNKLAGVADDDKGKIEINELHKSMFNEGGMHIVICVEYGTHSTEKVVGVSSMKLVLRTDPDTFDIKPQTKVVQKLFEIIEGMMAMYSIPENHSVDKWYDGRGIIVHPDYRRLGIGSALVASRKQICKDQGVPITSAWMTSIGTQKAAEKDGWETTFEIDSHEFAKIFNVIPYEGIAPTFKEMVGKV